MPAGNQRHAGMMNAMHNDPGQDAPELRYYLGLLQRRIWMVVTCFVIVVTLGAIHTYKKPPVYRASGRVLVQHQLPQIVELSRTAQYSRRREGDSQQTQMELIKSPAILEKAARDERIAEALNPDRSGSREGGGWSGGLWTDIKRTVAAVLGTRAATPNRPPKPWEILRDKINVSPVPETDMLTITAESARPKLAARLANAVVDAYCGYHREQQKKEVSQAFRLLGEQKDKQENKLDEAEKQLQEYREKVNAISLEEENGGEGGLFGELRGKLTDIQMQRVNLAARIDFLKGKRSANPATRLHTYMLSVPGKDVGPELASLREQFRQAREQARRPAQNLNKDVSQHLQTLRNTLENVRIQQSDIAGKLAFLKKEASGNPGHDLPEHMLALGQTGEESALRTLWQELLAARKEVEMLSKNYGPQAPQRQAGESRLEVLQKQIEVVAKERLAGLKTRLHRLKQKEEELEREYERRREKGIEETKKTGLARTNALQEQLDEALAEHLKALQVRMRMLREEENQLEQRYLAQKQEAVERAKQSVKYSRLKSRVDRNRQLFNVLVQRLREVDLTSNYPSAHVEVMEAASIPPIPAGPRKMRLILLYCFLGLALGGGLAFFADYLDDAIKTPEDVKRYGGTNVLGFVPTMDAAPDSREDFQYHGLISHYEPSSSPSEAYREIRTNLFFSGQGGDNKTTVITSAGAREGKTTTAANLACVIAQSGHKVLLVDADLRRPMIHKVTGNSSRPGLTNILTGQATLEESVKPVFADDEEGNGADGPDMLASGPIPPNPAEMLESEAMETFLEEAAEKYDRVILDSPPVLVATDPSVLAVRCDSVILVVEAEQSARSAVRHAADQLRGVNANLVGGILNNVQVSRLNYYYSDYYYHGYSRYYRDYGKDYYSNSDKEQKSAVEG
ncbi:MAG: polysaccharide biosynthesis tyrosine autokinase [Candidatus Brocadiia bacterium]